MKGKKSLKARLGLQSNAFESAVQFGSLLRSGQAWLGLLLLCAGSDGCFIQCVALDAIYTPAIIGCLFLKMAKFGGCDLYSGMTYTLAKTVTHLSP